MTRQRRTAFGRPVGHAAKKEIEHHWIHKIIGVGINRPGNDTWHSQLIVIHIHVRQIEVLLIGLGGGQAEILGRNEVRQNVVAVAERDDLSKLTRRNGLAKVQGIGVWRPRRLRPFPNKPSYDLRTLGGHYRRNGDGRRTPVAAVKERRDPGRPRGLRTSNLLLRTRLARSMVSAASAQYKAI